MVLIHVDTLGERFPQKVVRKVGWPLVKGSFAWRKISGEYIGICSKRVLYEEILCRERFQKKNVLRRGVACHQSGLSSGVQCTTLISNSLCSYFFLTV